MRKIGQGLTASLAKATSGISTGVPNSGIIDAPNA